MVENKHTVILTSGHAFTKHNRDRLERLGFAVVDYSPGGQIQVLTFANPITEVTMGEHNAETQPS